MSHAAHFLTRLERLKAPEVELALALYRDPRIVKELISSLALENNSDRVALAMTEDAKGPWLIVSADGGFVTCLGRGMRLKNKHVVSRARVDEALMKKSGAFWVRGCSRSSLAWSLSWPSARCSLARSSRPSPRTTRCSTS